MQISGAFEGLGLRGNDSAPMTLRDLKVEIGDLISPMARVPPPC